MNSKEIIIKYAVHPFNLYEKNIVLWNNLKLLFCCSYLISSLIISNYFIKLFKFKKLKFSQKISKKIKKNMPSTAGKLNLLIGKKEKNQENIYIPEKGLYQNFLITGTIGSGKTSSAMYPLTKQLLNFSDRYDEKIGILLLDVKGNYYKQVKEFAYECGRIDDVVVIEIGGKYKYNPLDKPDLKPSVLANRLRTILDLFSGESSESYWTDKSEQILSECIKFCRIYNGGYVNFEEIHKLVTSREYYNQKIDVIRELFLKNNLSKENRYNLITSINFFEQEFFKLDQRTEAILKSQITRITGCFMSDYEVSRTFNSKKDNGDFIDLSQIINDGKIVVLNMNIAEYKNLSKIIAAYLKLDFQAEVLSRLSVKEKNKNRAVAFISDEYQEYITETDGDFYAQSREAKCINIVATQSYTSMLKTLKNEHALKVITQNLINKIWFRTDDLYTVEEAQKQIGQEEKEKISKSISENAKETKYSRISKTFKSKDSSISESISTSLQKEYLYDIKMFTQELQTFQAISFLSDGYKILKPEKLEMIPYFKKGSD